MRLRLDELSDRLEDRASEEALARITLEHIVDAVILTDDAGALHYVCPNVEVIFDRRAEDVLRDGHVSTLLDPAVLRAEGLDASGLVTNLPATVHDARGRPHDLLITLRRVSIASATLLIVCRDVSELKRGERALDTERLDQARNDKAEALARVAGAVAHEFNNLLTAVMSFSALARETLPVDSTAHRDLERVIGAASHGRGLTDRLLAFAQPPAAAAGALRADERLRALVPTIQRRLSPRVRLHARITDSPCWVRMEASPFDRLVLNLVTNALEALESWEAEGRLSLVLRREESEAGATIVLVVKDDGPGLDAEMRARLFEPFFTTRNHRLGGLGLPTCRSIVEAAGGSIELKPSEHRGTIVEVRLPAEAVEGEAPSSKPETDEAGTLLVVEDDELVRGLCERVLESAGYRVEVAGSAEEALDAASRWTEPPRLLVTDLLMPGRTGRELGDLLKARWPGLPIAYVTGFTEDAEALRDVEGGVPLLRKPFTPEELLDFVRGALTPAGRRGPAGES